LENWEAVQVLWLPYGDQRHTNVNRFLFRYNCTVVVAVLFLPKLGPLNGGLFFIACRGDQQPSN
jgi:hypothetical protein